MFSVGYEQVSTEPLRFERKGDSPTDIARILGLVGLVGVVLSGLLAISLVSAEGEVRALGGCGLMVFGCVLLVGAFRYGVEQASRTMIVTQPGFFQVTREGGVARIEADRHTFVLRGEARVELHQMQLPEEVRYVVVVIAAEGIIELQVEQLAIGRFLANNTCAALGLPGFQERERPTFTLGIGLAGALMMLFLCGLVGVSVWAMAAEDMLTALLASASVVAMGGLQYPAARSSGRSMVREFLRDSYGIAVE
ncbi:MAG: hypothetical protein AAF799_46235 [Myxococcota bacterium]